VQREAIDRALMAAIDGGKGLCVPLLDARQQPGLVVRGHRTRSIEAAVGSVSVHHVVDDHCREAAGKFHAA
jgi:hypothetical protein